MKSLRPATRWASLPLNPSYGGTVGFSIRQEIASACAARHAKTPLGASAREDDEVRLGAGLRAQPLIGDDQRGALGHQPPDALERDRRNLDPLERLGGGGGRRRGRGMHHRLDAAALLF